MSARNEKKHQSDYSDAILAPRLATERFSGQFRWSPGQHWLQWNGSRWRTVNVAVPIEEGRAWVAGELKTLIGGLRVGEIDGEEVKKWTALLSRNRISAIVGLCQGQPGILAGDDEFDAHADMLNTPAGVVDLATGEVVAHDPNLLLTKITRGNYVAGFTHPDWEMALEALRPAEQEWFQARIGQAITGHPTPDGIMPVLQGSGENGKSLLTTDGLVPALGDYGSLASAKLVSANRGGEHSTEMADLRGKRLLIAEEMTEKRALDVTTIKRVQDVGRIRARALYRDNMEFDASHSLFVTTNYVPVVNETDHGTWRRLALLRFPFTFRKAGDTLDRPTDRRGDPGLKARLRQGAEGQHDAVVTWAVEGALRVHRIGPAALAVTPRIRQDTDGWRGSADRILGYWNERLIPDASAKVSAGDLLADFNTWLVDNGHAHRWSRETFAPRFAEHFRTQDQRVVQERTRELAGLVPRFGVMPTGGPDARLSVWVGVRWRTPADDAAEDAEIGAGV